MNRAALLARELGAGRRRYHSALRKCRKRPTVSRVHEARVEARHLQVRLELSGAVLGKPSAEKAIRKVTRHLHSLGPLRDVQVGLRRLQALAPAIAGLEPLSKHLRRRRRRLAQAAAKHLEGKGLYRRLRAVEAALRARPLNASSERRVRGALCRAVRQARRQMAASRMRAGAGSAGLHRARVALKRYLLMAAAARALNCPSPNLTALGRDLRILGGIHDTDVLMAGVPRWSSRGIIPAAAADSLRQNLARDRLKLLKSWSVRKFRSEAANPCGAGRGNKR